MREAIGGSSLLYLVIIIVSAIMLMFSSALTYSKAYKVKKQIVKTIERYGMYEAIDKNGENKLAQELNSNLKMMGYDASKPTRCSSVRNNLIDSSNGKYNDKDLSQNLNVNYGYNYCVFESTNTNDTTGGKYYVVVTFGEFQFPIIGNILTFPVYGETQILDKNFDYQ